MRIAVTINTFSPRIGGAEIVAETLARGLAARGHLVTVLTRRIAAYPIEEDFGNGVRVVRLWGKGRWSFCIACSLWLILNHGEFDLVHAHQTGSPLLAAIFGSTVGRWAVVCTVHSPADLYWLRQCRWLLRRRLYGRTDTWIGISREIANALAATRRRRVHYLANGVDTSRFVAGPRMRDTCPCVVTVSRLEHPKRVDLILRAWAGLREPGRLLIVGDGPERSMLERLAEELCLKRVEFLGFRHDTDRILQVADIFVLSSDSEGMPVALLEAMSSELFCIASAVGEIPSVLTGSGIVVAANSVEGLMAALTRAFESASWRAELGRIARDRVLENYSLNRSVDAVEGIYLDLLDRVNRTARSGNLNS